MHERKTNYRLLIGIAISLKTLPCMITICSFHIAALYSLHVLTEMVKQGYVCSNSKVRRLLNVSGNFFVAKLF